MRRPQADAVSSTALATLAEFAVAAFPCLAKLNGFGFFPVRLGKIHADELRAVQSGFARRKKTAKKTKNIAKKLHNRVPVWALRTVAASYFAHKIFCPAETREPVRSEDPPVLMRNGRCFPGLNGGWWSTHALATHAHQPASRSRFQNLSCESGKREAFAARLFSRLGLTLRATRLSVGPTLSLRSGNLGFDRRTHRSPPAGICSPRRGGAPAEDLA